MAEIMYNSTGTTSNYYKIGKKGLSIYQGETEPQSSLGKNGDVFFLVNDLPKMFRKEQGIWLESEIKHIEEIIEDTTVSIDRPNSTYFVNAMLNEWVFSNHTDSVRAIRVDNNNNNAYTGSSDTTVRKIDSNGNEVWQFTNHSSGVRSVAVEPEGSYIYSGSTDGTIRKMDSNGTEQWSFTNHTDSVLAIDVDTNGNIYSGAADSTVRKIDSDGNQLWSFTNHTGDVLAVVVDTNGNIYSGAGDSTIRKIDSDGNQLWSFTNHTANVFSLALDSNNNIYSGSGDSTVRKIDPQGNEVWQFTGHTNSVRSLAVDINDKIYSGSSDITIRKIDQQGSEEWSYTEHTGTIFGLDARHSTVYSASGDGDARRIDVNTKNITLTISTSSSLKNGYEFTVKDFKGASSGNAITIKTDGSETIDGNTQVVIDSNYMSLTIVYYNSNWYII